MSKNRTIFLSSVWGVCLGFALMVCGAEFVGAQSLSFTLPKVPKQEYVKPFDPLQVIGNLYSVGTYGLGVCWITTPRDIC